MATENKGSGFNSLEHQMIQSGIQCDNNVSKRFWKIFNQRCQGRFSACYLFYSNMYYPEFAGNYENDMVKQFGDMFSKIDMHCAYKRYFVDHPQETKYNKANNRFMTIDDKFEDI